MWLLAKYSRTGDFRDVGVTEFSKVLPPSEKWPLSELSDPLNSLLSFLLTPRDVWKEGFSISLATRPQLSHRKFHDGEHTAFLRKLSPPVLLGIVWSFAAATQQADPMITAGHTHNTTVNLSYIQRYKLKQGKLKTRQCRKHIHLHIRSNPNIPTTKSNPTAF